MVVVVVVVVAVGVVVIAVVVIGHRSRESRIYNIEQPHLLFR